MAKVSLLGNAMNTIGTLPAKGSIAPDFEATKGDLSTLKLSDLRGKRWCSTYSPASTQPPALPRCVTSTQTLRRWTTLWCSASLRICPSPRAASVRQRV